LFVRNYNLVKTQSNTTESVQKGNITEGNSCKGKQERFSELFISIFIAQRFVQVQVALTENVPITLSISSWILVLICGFRMRWN